MNARTVGRRIPRTAERPDFFNPKISTLQGQVARLAVYALCFFDYGVREFAPVIYGIVLLLATLCVSRATKKILVPFVPLTIVTASYALLSWQRVFDPAWTILFDSGVILRQAMWIATLPLLINLGACYTKEVLRHHSAREFWTILVLLCCNFSVSGMLVSDWSYSIWSYGPFGYLWAPLSIFLTVAAWAILVDRKLLPAMGFFFLTIAVMLLADSSQTRIAYLLVAAVILGQAKGKLVSILAFIVSASFVFGGYAWAIIDPISVASMDPNAAVRGLMVQHSYEAARTTDFIGIGFGTEGVKNSYPEMGLQQLSERDENFILIAPHNAFIDVFMRMGILGLGVLVWALISLIRPFSTDERNYPFRMVLASLALVNLSINVGLQSPFHLSGVAIMLGACFTSRRTRASTESAWQSSARHVSARTARGNGVATAHRGALIRNVQDAQNSDV